MRLLNHDKEDVEEEYSLWRERWWNVPKGQKEKATEVSAQCTSQRPVRDELGELERARYWRPCRHSKESNINYNAILSNLCFKIILASMKNGGQSREREWNCIYFCPLFLLGKKMKITTYPLKVKDTASSKLLTY